MSKFIGKTIVINPPLSPVKATRNTMPINMDWVKPETLERLPDTVVIERTYTLEEQQAKQDSARARSVRESKQRANQITKTTYVKVAGKAK